MTFTFVGSAGSASGTTSVTPPMPVTAQPGHLLVAVVDSGHPTSSTQPQVSDGWELAGTVVGTSGVYGEDTGPRRLSLFLRLMQGTDDDRPTFTLTSGTECRVGACVFAWSFAAGASVQWQAGFGEDSSSGTGFAPVTTTALDLAVGDVLQMSYVANTDAVTWSGQALSATGITFAAATELIDSASVVGADASRSTARTSVTAGTGSGNVTMSATMSGAAIGVAGVIRLRDTATGGTAASATVTYDDDLARVVIDATGMSALADVARVERSIDGGATWTTVRGATAAPVVSGVLVTVSDFEFVDQVATTYRVTGYVSASGVPTDVETATITPNLFYVWLKSVPRPFLNTAVEVVFRNPVQVTRPSRTGVFDIIGRSSPVAVSDVRKSRRWVMYVRTETFEDASAIDLLLASGDALYVHVPAGCPADIIPNGYVAIGDATTEWHPLRPESRLWILPAVEVAPPPADVSGALGTYQTVADTFTDYADVLASHSSYAELLALVGSPSEVVVP